MNDQQRKNIVYGVLAFFGLALLALPFYLYNSTYSFKALDILIRFSLHTAAFLTAILTATFAVSMIGKAASTAASKMSATVVAKIGTTIVAPLLVVASGAAVTSYSILKKPENLNSKIIVQDSVPRRASLPDTTAYDSTSINAKVNNLVPMVIPKTNLVAAGDEYVADLFAASSLSGQDTAMYYNGQKLTVIEDPKTKLKKGKIKFLATAAAYDASGLSKQTFKARIDVQGKSYENVIEYFVVKPTIRITTGNAPQLYFNCGNMVNIEVPALGIYYKPTFSATGARIITSEKAGRITIVPSQIKVAVTIMNDGNVLGTELFDVKRIPRPNVICRDQAGRAIDLKTGIPAIAGLTQLRVSVEPDENFKESVPKDAVYRVRSMEVVLRRGVSAMNIILVNSEVVDLSGWRANFRPGDVIVCNIKSVVRITYLNEEESVDIGSNNYQFIPLL